METWGGFLNKEVDCSLRFKENTFKAFWNQLSITVKSDQVTIIVTKNIQGVLSPQGGIF